MASTSPVSKPCQATSSARVSVVDRVADLLEQALGDRDVRLGADPLVDHQLDGALVAGTAARRGCGRARTGAGLGAGCGAARRGRWGRRAGRGRWGGRRAAPTAGGQGQAEDRDPRAEPADPLGSLGHLFLLVRLVPVTLPGDGLSMGRPRMGRSSSGVLSLPRRPSSSGRPPAPWRDPVEHDPEQDDRDPSRQPLPKFDRWANPATTS